MNVFLEILWFMLLFCYYTLEATVLFFVPSRYRRKDVNGQIVLITGAGAYLMTTGVALPRWSRGTVVEHQGCSPFFAPQSP